MYFPEGKIAMHGYMKNGLKDSLNTFYYPNGKIWSRSVLHQDTLWEVLFTNDSLGNPLPTGDLKNGNGYQIDYNMNGKKWLEGN